MARHRKTREQADAADMAAYAGRVRAAGDVVALAAPDDAGPVRRVLRRMFGGPQPVVEERSITGLPWNQGGGAPSAVDAEKALTLIPVYAACRLLADTIASLPVHRYRMDKQGKVREQLPDPQLFIKPSVVGTFADWLHRCVTSMALTGNAFGLITATDSTGYPSMVEWMNPNEVTVLDKAFDGPGSFLQPQFYWRGRLLNPPGTRLADVVVHIPWFTQPYRVAGLSPIGAAKATISTGLSAQDYSNSWFQSGGVPPGKFKNSAKTLDDNQAAEIRQRLTNTIRSGKPLVYGSDWDYEPIATPPDEAQFIQTLQMTATQIASIYGIPPEMIGGATAGNLTYSTPVLRGDDLVRFSLQPWLARMEAVFSTLLPRPQFAAFDTDKLTTPDALTRRQIYKIDTEIGLRTANEMRATENLEPLAHPLPAQLPGKELTEPGGTPPPPSSSTAPVAPKPQPALNGNRSDDGWDWDGDRASAAAWALYEQVSRAVGHEKVGHTDQGLWKHKGWQLPAYIQHVANDLIASGHGESHAIELAVGIVKNWAHGHDGKGHTVSADTAAKAAAALAEWEALKAAASKSKRDFDADWDLDDKTLQLSLNGAHDG